MRALQNDREGRSPRANSEPAIARANSELAIVASPPGVSILPDTGELRCAESARAAERSDAGKNLALRAADADFDVTTDHHRYLPHEPQCYQDEGNSQEGYERIKPA
jgi:hypothetical protein